MRNEQLKNYTLYLLLVLIVYAAFAYNMEGPREVDVPYSTFYEDFSAGRIYEMVLSEGYVLYRRIGDPSHVYRTNAIFDQGDLVRFREKKIEYVDPRTKKKLTRIRIKVKPPSEVPWWLSLLGSWIPFFILIFVWFYLLHRMQGGGARALSFGKSRARFIDNKKTRTTFKDVAGCDEAKADLQEIIEFLKNPEKFRAIGARIPRGVLLMGPPGTGKTLLARAVAGEADVPFLHISGSDFVEMFVGVGASRVRDLFEQGKRHAPCLIFIDEIDAVGRQRGAGLGGGHDEREQTLNQLLVEMDGFDPNEGVIMIAATNRPDVLDPALLRPGRFDRQIVVDLPDLNGRKGIFDVHLRKIPIADDVDVDILARATPGFSGADIANMVNEAALLAARRNRTKVTMRDFEDARDKVIMGPERRSKYLTDAMRERIAYHEAGHALVNMLLPGMEEVHKVSIIPRGRALGITSYLPDEEKLTLRGRSYILNSICVLMAGRVAEELKFGEPTSGAANDIERATRLVHQMICEFGMSERLGPISYGEDTGLVFLGRDLARDRNYSEQTAREIDEEVRRLVMECYERTRDLLRKNYEVLEAIAAALIRYEVLEGDDIEAIMRGEEPAAASRRKEAADEGRRAEGTGDEEREDGDSGSGGS